MSSVYSLHPSLRRVQLAAVTQDAGGGVGGGGGGMLDSVDTPYPTLAQHEKTEKRYASAMEEYETALAEYRTNMAERPVHQREPEPMPPVRQPPTMLAAMQRPDLTADARKTVLRKLAPRISTMDKKYKFIFSSDARRNPLHSTSSDFTVDVTTDLIAPKINGFEIIGYSFPQSEWSIEPYEISMPFRYGWCPCPGRRQFGIHTKAFDVRIPMAELPDRILAPRQPFPFAYTARSDYVISCELPLVRNPIVRIQVVAATAALPKRVRLTFARRVGSDIGLFASNSASTHASAAAALPMLILDDVGVLATGQFPGRYVLRKDGLVQPPQVNYFERHTSQGLLPDEPPLSLRETYDPSLHGDGIDPHYTLSIVDPDFTRHFVDNTNAAVTVRTDYNSLGSMHCRPATRASEFAFRLSLMLGRVLERRRIWEESTGSSIHIPLRSAVVEWADQRFVLRAGWNFGRLEALGYASIGDVGRRAVEMGMDADTMHRLVTPLTALCSDHLGVHFGLPMELGAVAMPESFLSTTIPAANPPRLRPETTIDVEPMADPTALEGYFKSLNTAATSVRFQPAELAPLTSPLFFTVPIALADTVHHISITSGEYRPWQLAHTLTQAVASNPNLRPLRIVVTPAFLDHNHSLAGNSIAGFRFESLSGMPFDLAFDAGNANLVAPTKLGYRKLRYGGQSVYDPIALSVMDDPYAGLTLPITFPAADLGHGVEVFSPMPTTPFILPVFNNKRLQISHNALPADHVSLARYLPPISLTSSQQLALERTMLFHHLQPIRLQLTVRPDLLILNSVAGTAEASAAVPSSTVLAIAPTSGMIYSSASATSSTATPATIAAALASFTYADILSTLALVNDPLNAAPGFLRDIMVRLVGRVGVSYAGFAPTGIMTTDGPYRILHSTLTPSQLAAHGIPTSEQVDALLASLCSNVQTRNVFSALASTIVRVIRSSALQGTPIHLLAPTHPLFSLTATNNSVALTNLAVVIASYAVLGSTTGSASSSVSYASSSSSSIATAFSRSFLLELVNLAMWKASSSSPLITADPLTVPTLILQGVTYLVRSTSPITVTTSSASVDVSRVATWQIGEDLWGLTLLSEACRDVAAGPYTININPLHTNVPIQNLVENGTGLTHGNIISGKTYTLNYAAGLTPFNPVMPAHQVSNVIINTTDRSITFTVRHNVVGGQIQAIFDSYTTVTTLNLVDNTETQLAKMVLVASNYSFAVPGFAELDLTGTNANPFVASPSPSPADPGLVSNRFVQFKATTSPIFAAPPGTVPSPTAVDIRSVFSEMVAVVALTPLLLGEPDDSIPATAVVSRINEHPFSIDFCAQTPLRIRADRLGMVDGFEYSADIRRVPVGGDPLTLHLGSIGSAVDIDRSGPPYLLLNIEINGDPTPYTSSLRPDGLGGAGGGAGASGSGSIMFDAITRLQNHAHRGEVISIGSRRFIHPPGPTIIRSTAYVELGSDQTTLRLLDRQDDRAPVLFPTSINVNWVRFLVTRPDGTPYNFHGRKTMVGLRFMSHPDNPDFVGAIANKDRE